MTNVFKCDKCGKLFDDYDECYAHEESHWTITYWDDLYDEVLKGMTEYKEGQEEPNVVHMVFYRWNSEKGTTERRCGKYKLISSYEAPLVIAKE